MYEDFRVANTDQNPIYDSTGNPNLQNPIYTTSAEYDKLFEHQNNTTPHGTSLDNYSKLGPTTSGDVNHGNNRYSNVHTNALYGTVAESPSVKLKYQNASFDDGNGYDSLHNAVSPAKKIYHGENNSNYDHLEGKRNSQGVEDEYAVVNKTPNREIENSTMQNMIYEEGSYDSLHNQQQQQQQCHPPNVILNDTYDSLNHHNHQSGIPQHQNVTTNTIYDSLDQQQVVPNRQQPHDNGYDNLHDYQEKNRANSNVMHNELYGSIPEANTTKEGRNDMPDLQHQNRVAVDEDEYAVVDKSGLLNNKNNNSNVMLNDTYDNLQHQNNVAPATPVVEDEYAVVDKSGKNKKNNNSNVMLNDTYDNLQHQNNVAPATSVVEDEYAVVDKSRKNKNNNVMLNETYGNLDSVANHPAIVEDEYAVVDKSMKNGKPKQPASHNDNDGDYTPINQPITYDSTQKPLPQAPRLSMSDILSQLDESAYNNLHESINNSHPDYHNLTLGREPQKTPRGGARKGADYKKLGDENAKAKTGKKEKEAKKKKADKNKKTKSKK